MRTLADIKRRMAPGARLAVLEQTKRPVLVGTVRTVLESNTAGMRFTSSNTGTEDYRQAWPKAADVRIIDADTYEVSLRGPGMAGHVIRLRFLSVTYQVATATGVSRPAFSPSGQQWTWTPQNKADYGSLAEAITAAEAIPATDGLLVQLCRYPAPDPHTAPCMAQRIGRGAWRADGRELASLSELLGAES